MCCTTIDLTYWLRDFVNSYNLLSLDPTSCHDKAVELWRLFNPLVWVDQFDIDFNTATNTRWVFDEDSNWWCDAETAIPILRIQNPLIWREE